MRVHVSVRVCAHVSECVCVRTHTCVSVYTHVIVCVSHVHLNPRTPHGNLIELDTGPSALAAAVTQERVPLLMKRAGW